MEGSHIVDKPTTVQQIYSALSNYFLNGYKYSMSNTYIFHHDWESDFFCINMSGYSFEIEVKVSKSDFRADFKKEKHKLFLEPDGKRLLPNRFYYAVPKDLIAVEDVPVYAGLMYVENGHVLIVKKAPFIHKKKYDLRKKLCDKFYFQWMILKKDKRILGREVDNLRKKLDKIENG